MNIHSRVRRRGGYHGIVTTVIVVLGELEGTVCPTYAHCTTRLRLVEAIESSDYCMRNPIRF